MSFVRVVPQKLQEAAGALQQAASDIASTEPRVDFDMTEFKVPGDNPISQEAQRFLTDHASQYYQITGRAWPMFNEFVASLSHAAGLYWTADVDNSRDMN